MFTSLDYAKMACETMMKRFQAEDLPPKGHFHYHQGVFLSGVLKTWSLTGNESYFYYAKKWIDSVFDENGAIKEYAHADLDDIQPGILLFPIWNYTKNPFYEKCLKNVFSQIADIPRCECSGFYHKVSFTRQMWLDGLYMVGPFLAEYAKVFHQPDLYKTIVQEVQLMQKNTEDKKSGLWYHAWDESRSAEWADSVSGHSSEFWGRSLGWVPVAILDILEQMSPSDDGYEYLQKTAINLLTAICQYQGKDGRWYQVVNKPDQPGNWPENSCTCLFAAALSRAVKNGWLDSSYLIIIQKAYQGVVNSLTFDGKDLLIGQVCIGTGVGNYDFYCNRPVSVNDLHGVGAFLLMCCELADFEKTRED